MTRPRKHEPEQFVVRVHNSTEAMTFGPYTKAVAESAAHDFNLKWFPQSQAQVVVLHEPAMLGYWLAGAS